MANEALSVKLHELDEKISRVYSRILMIESADHASIQHEKAAMQIECERTEISIRDQMQHSQSSIVGSFREAYKELEDVLDDTKTRLGIILNRTSDEDPSALPTLASLTQEDLSAMEPDALTELTERKILLAEYALDFAMLAADHALLFALDAVDSQMTSEEKAAAQTV